MLTMNALEFLWHTVNSSIFCVRDVYVCVPQQHSGEVCTICKGSEQLPEHEQQSSERHSAEETQIRNMQIRLAFTFTGERVYK